jgi:hypothetical protein
MYVETTVAFICFLLKEYQVDLLIGASISTHLLIDNLNLFLSINKSAKILLVSPQLTFGLMDSAMGTLMSVLISLSRLFKKDLYNKFINIKKVRDLWTESIAADTKRKLTRDLLLEDFVQSQYPGNPKSYLAFTKNKRELISKIQKSEFIIDPSHLDNIYIVYGNNDKLLSFTEFDKVLKYLNIKENKIFKVQSNHIVELEAYEELTNIVNKIMKWN